MRAQPHEVQALVEATTGALTTVADGWLRLQPHAELSPSVRVGPGPMLDREDEPSGIAANDRAGDRDGEVA